MNTPELAESGAPLRDYLFGLTLHGIKLGLDNIRFLLDAADNPQLSYPTVHVAGTNGKGSVLAVLAAILRAAGYRVGRFTSPHLIDVNERFLIDGAPVSDELLDENIAYFQAIAETMDGIPTFFEMNTAIAFRLFQQQQVDIALIEVGMGGRFDSTNVIAPVATAITSIGIDHTEFLGDTPEAIAGEKAGIIKSSVPLVVGTLDEGPRSVILAEAQRCGAQVSLAGQDFTSRYTGDAWSPRLQYQSQTMQLDDAPCALPGDHQAGNAGVSVALAEVLRDHFPRIDETAITTGLRAAQWPGRLEQVLNAPPVYIDAAHNPAGAQRIAEMPGRWTVLLAVSADKDAAGIIKALAPVADAFILSEYSGRRAMPTAELATLLDQIPHESLLPFADALTAGIAAATDAAPLLITGSIYTAGEARDLLTRHHGAPPIHF